MTRTRKNIARVGNILNEGRRSLCKLIAEWMGIPKTIAQQILRVDLQKRKLCMRFVPHAFTAEQKEQCLNHAYNFIETIKSNPNFLDSISTGDKSWCFANFHIGVVTKKPPMCQIMRFSLYCVNGLIEGRRIA